MSLPRLPFHEWSIIILFCAILLSLAAHAFLGRGKITIPAEFTRDVKKENSLDEQIQVKVIGEVQKPGLYEISSTSTLKNLLDLVQPLPTADLSQLKWRRKLRNGQTIRVLKGNPITIRVTGAVQEPCSLEILSGTRVCELADRIAFTSESDVKAFTQKKRYLHDGDEVNVPFKKNNKLRKKIK